MNNRKSIFAIMIIIILVIILILSILLIYNGQGNTVKQPASKDNLFFVTTDATKKLGISRTDGTVVFNFELEKILRVSDYVYLKTSTESAIYSLVENKIVTNLGKESEIYCAYDSYKKVLPYFILKFGIEDITSIYRVLNANGTRVSNKDFSSLNEAYDSIGAKRIFTAQKAEKNIIELYSVIDTLEYPDANGNSQYIVKNKENKFGIVTSNLTVVLEPIYSKITKIENSENVFKVDKDNNSYIHFIGGLEISIEKDFDIVSYNKYFIQKRGNIVNKVYDTKGQVIIDNILDLNTDLFNLNVNETETYLLVQEEKSKFKFINISNENKVSDVFTYVETDYLKEYSKYASNTAMIYKKNTSYYALDLKDFKSYNLKITSEVVSPLDIGNIYKSK